MDWWHSPCQTYYRIASVDAYRVAGESIEFMFFIDFFLPFLEKSAQRKLLVRLSRSIHIRLTTSRWSRKCLWGLLYQIVYSGRSKLLLQDLPLWPNAEIPAEFTNLCPFWTMSETKDFNRPFACTVSNRAQNFRSGAPQATGNTLSP